MLSEVPLKTMQILQLTRQRQSRKNENPTKFAF